jgi:hypothetical protein
MMEAAITAELRDRMGGNQSAVALSPRVAEKGRVAERK